MLAQSIFGASVSDTLHPEPFEDLFFIELTWTIEASGNWVVAISCTVRDFIKMQHSAAFIILGPPG